MRPVLGTALLPVTLRTLLQRSQQPLVLVPSGAILEARLVPQQVLAGVLEATNHRLERRAPGPIDLCRELCEFRIPALETRRRRPASKCGIALFQRTPEPAPGAEELLFHVERDPVEVASTLVRRAGDQFMHIRINDLQRQCCRQRCGSAVLLAVDARFQSLLAIANPHFGRPLAGFGQPEQHKFLCSVLYQVARRRAAKGLAAAQVCDCLDHAGLARGVAPKNKVVVWVRVELDAFQAAEVARRKM